MHAARTWTYHIIVTQHCNYHFSVAKCFAGCSHIYTILMKYVKACEMLPILLFQVVSLIKELIYTLKLMPKILNVHY